MNNQNITGTCENRVQGEPATGSGATFIEHSRPRLLQPELILTASSLNTFLICQRKYYWRYEMGLAREEKTTALAFGTMWHLAMEERWQGKDFDTAYTRATSKLQDYSNEINEVDLAMLSALLAAYYRIYEGDNVKVISELQFKRKIKRKTFVSGKIDGLAPDCCALIEHKTTGEDISPSSDYWLRLRFNIQLNNYIIEARKIGYNVDRIIYDVVRKPLLRLKQNETIEQYSERLFNDCLERKDFYFARREVCVLDDTLKEFEVLRDNACDQIRFLQKKANKQSNPADVWLQNFSPVYCKSCEYSVFCLQGIKPDLNSLPSGFVIKPIHEELNENNNRTTDNGTQS